MNAPLQAGHVSRDGSLALGGKFLPMKLNSKIAAENPVDGRNPAPAGMYKTL